MAYTLPTTLDTITTSAALDYTREFFASIGTPVQIYGAIKSPADDFDCRDVLFMLDSHACRMTVWIERPEASPAYIYGEW